jgi:hypothetical protein
VTISDRRDEFAQLIASVATIVDEVKLLSLNLTIGNAKLRLTDNAFQSVASSVRELLDLANDSSAEAEVALKKARGEKLSDSDRRYTQKELDRSLEKIKRGAEHIIQSVVSIKKGQKINRQF